MKLENSITYKNCKKGAEIKRFSTVCMFVFDSLCRDSTSRNSDTISAGDDVDPHLPLYKYLNTVHRRRAEGVNKLVSDLVQDIYRSCCRHTHTDGRFHGSEIVAAVLQHI